MSAALIISNEYLEQMRSFITEHGAAYETLFTSYDDILQRICTEGIIEGDVHDKLLLFTESFDCLKEELTEITKQMDTYLLAFQQDINDHDLYTIR